MAALRRPRGVQDSRFKRGSCHEQGRTRTAVGGGGYRRRHFARGTRGAASYVNAVWLVTAALSVYFIAGNALRGVHRRQGVAARRPHGPRRVVRHNDGLTTCRPTRSCCTATLRGIAGRPLVGPVLGPDGLPARHVVDPGGRGGRRGPGLHRPFFVDAARRQVTGEMIKMELGLTPGAGAGGRAGDA